MIRPGEESTRLPSRPVRERAAAEGGSGEEKAWATRQGFETRRDACKSTDNAPVDPPLFVSRGNAVKPVEE